MLICKSIENHIRAVCSLSKVPFKKISNENGQFNWKRNKMYRENIELKIMSFFLII